MENITVNQDSELYTIDWFIDFFKSKNGWRTTELCFDGKCCAMGHLGLRSSDGNEIAANKAVMALGDIFRKIYNVSTMQGDLPADYFGRIYPVNDGNTYYTMNSSLVRILNEIPENRPDAPKKRILATLQFIKENFS